MTSFLMSSEASIFHLSQQFCRVLDRPVYYLVLRVNKSCAWQLLLLFVMDFRMILNGQFTQAHRGKFTITIEEQKSHNGKSQRNGLKGRLMRAN